MRFNLLLNLGLDDKTHAIKNVGYSVVRAGLADSHDVTNAEERKEERPALPVICEAMRGAANEADGTRTRNHRIDSPGVTQVHEPSNSVVAIRLANFTLSREFSSTAPDPANVPIDPELAAIFERWADLPQAVRAAMIAMVRATDFFANQE